MIILTNQMTKTAKALNDNKTKTRSNTSSLSSKVEYQENLKVVSAMHRLLVAEDMQMNVVQQ